MTVDRQSQELDTITAIVVDRGVVRVLHPLSRVDAVALQTCAAEDPANWNDIVSVWPRHRWCTEVMEFADALPVRETDPDTVCNILADSEAWIILDLSTKRLLTNESYSRAVSTLSSGDLEAAEWVRINLPPWWESLSFADFLDLGKARLMPIDKPDPRRDVLWGSALTSFVAEEMIRNIRAGKKWIGKDWDGNDCGNYELTVDIHRKWLMTPRPELNGGIPRDCLYGGHHWASGLADSQSYRVMNGEESIPVPEEMASFETAPFGRHEIIFYFEGCRATINAGWLWLLADRSRIVNPAVTQGLCSAIKKALQAWMDTKHEDGPTPREVIRCERQRIPLIERDGGHLLDCDCPICQMLAEGTFGPAFICYDGHQLEIDNEFAFSLCETREEWEIQQQEWACINLRIDAQVKADECRLRNDEDSTENDFPSPTWLKGWQAEEGTPGDTTGHLSLAFSLAEMVGELRQNEVPQIDIDALNTAFRNFRTSSMRQECEDAAQTLKQILESLATKYEYLISCSADLQSRIDEQLRASVTGSVDRDISN